MLGAASDCARCSTVAAAAVGVGLGVLGYATNAPRRSKLEHGRHAILDPR